MSIAVKELNTKGGSNRFRFLSFADRLQSIQVDTSRRVRRQVVDDLSELKHDQESFFARTLHEWRELNCTRHFTLFHHQVYSKCTTFHQLIYHRNDIAEILLKHLRVPNSSAAEPLCRLVVSLAIDLRHEFLTYFPAFTRQLVEMIRETKQNTLTIEAGFQCLGYLFKYLRRDLILQFTQIFNLISPLLSDDNEAIRNFAGTGLAYLLRCMNRDQLNHPVQFICRYVAENSDREPAIISGTAALLAESIRGPKHSYHSRYPNILEHLYDFLKADSDYGYLSVYRLAELVILESLSHGRDEKNLLEFTQTCIRLMSDSSKGGYLMVRYGYLSGVIWCCLKISASAAALRSSSNNSLVLLLSSIIDELSECLDRDDPICVQLLKFLTAAIVQVLIVFGGEGSLTILKTIYARMTEGDISRLLTILVSQANHVDHWTVISYVNHICSDQSQLGESLCLHLPNIYAAFCNGCLKPSSNLRELSERWLNLLAHQLSHCENEKDSLFHVRFCAALEIGRAGGLPEVYISSLANNLFLSVLKLCESEPQNYLQTRLLGYLSAWLSCQQIGCFIDRLLPLLRTQTSRIGILESIHNYLKLVPDSERFSSFPVECLVGNLQSSLAPVRELTLKILKTIMSKSSRAVPDLLDSMLQVEEKPAEVSTFRERLMLLKRVEFAVKQHQSKLSQLLGLNFFLGQLTINFQPCWPETRRMLMETMDEKNELWNLWWNQVCLLSGNTIETIIPIDSTSWKQMFANDGLSVDNTSWLTDSATNPPLLRISLSNMFRRRLSYDQQVASYRFQPSVLYTQLLMAIRDHNAGLVESHGDIFATYFITCHENFTSICDTRAAPLRGPSDREKLEGCLDLMAKFRNPSKSYHGLANEVHSRLWNLMGSSQLTMQQKALSCLITFKNDITFRHRDTFERLLNENSFRDELSLIFASFGDGSNLEDSFATALAKVVYGRYLDRSSTKGAVCIIWSFLAAAPAICLDTFVSNALQSLSPHLDRGMETAPYLPLERLPSVVSHGILRGVCDFLDNVLTQIGRRMMPYFGKVLQVFLWIARDIDPGNHMLNYPERVSREFRIRGIKLLVKLFECASSNAHAYDFDANMDLIFALVVKSRLANFGAENAQTPGPLFSLFRVWGCQNIYHRYLFQSEGSILRSVCDVLTVRNVKVPSIKYVLDILEAVLPQIDECSILVQNVDMIIIAFQKLLERTQCDQGILGRIISITMALLPRTCSDETLSCICDLLLPFLERKKSKLHEVVKADIVKAIAANINRVFSKSENFAIRCTRYYTAMCSMLLEFERIESRQFVLAAFREFAIIDGSLEHIYRYLDSMNAVAVIPVESVDWDLRSKALKDVSGLNVDALDVLEWLPILNQLIFEMNFSDEMAVRHSASLVLRSVAQQLIPPCTYVGKEGMIRTLSAAIRSGISLRDFDRRREWVLILREVIRLQIHDSEYGSLKPLLAENDDEACFFQNIIHLQVHRRARAIRKLIALMKSGNLSIQAPIIRQLLLPLVTHFVFETDKRSHSNLLSASVDAIGYMSTFLSWSQYDALQKHYWKLFLSGKFEGKPVLKVFLAILENFPWNFSKMDVKYTLANAENDADMKRSKPADSSEPFPVLESAEPFEHFEDEPLELSKTICNVFRRQIAPRLYKLLSQREEGEANLASRVPIAMTYAVLLTKMPKSTLEAELPRLLLNVIQILKSRSQEVRDAARETLLKMARVLGKSHFPFIVRQLCFALTKGYEKHVLSYTVNFLLNGFIADCSIGDLDSVANQVMMVITDDLFGQVAEEKQVTEIAVKMKESQVSKSNQTIEIYSSIATSEALEQVLASIRSSLMSYVGPEFTNKMRELLKRLSDGICRNSSYEVVDFVLTVFNLISRSSALYEKLVESTENLLPVGVANQNLRVNDHLLMELGLQLLLTSLKKSKFNPALKEHLKLLDSLVEILKDLLSDANSFVVVLSFRNILSLLSFQLSSFGKHLKVCMDKAFNQIYRGSSRNSELNAISMKLISTIVRDHSEVLLTDKQVHYLINDIRVDLPTEDSGYVFTLVKAFLNRKIISVELYELMDEIMELSITSQSSTVRERSRQVFSMFLLNYPLGQKRLDRHICGLVKNLGRYQHESGRRSILKTLHYLVEKSPVSIVDQFGCMILIALAWRMATDESKECRELSALIFAHILSCCNLGLTHKSSSLISSWMKNHDCKVRCIGYQSFGIFIESGAGGGPDKAAVIRQFASQDGFIQIRGSFSSSDSDWKELYHCLIALEKCTVADQSLVAPIFQLLLDYMVELGTHEHPWVVLAFSRCLRSAMHSDLDVVDLVSSTGRLFKFCAVLVAQTQKTYLTAKLAEELVQIMASLARREVMFESVDIEVSEQAKSYSTVDNLFRWTLLSMIRQSRRHSLETKYSALLRLTVLETILRMIEPSSDEHIESCLRSILDLVCRTLSAAAPASLKPEIECVQTKAQALLAFLERRFGPKLVEIRIDVEKEITRIQQRRKQAVTQLAVINPEAAAKRKLARNRMKVEGRKRKATEMRLSKVRASVKKVCVAKGSCE